MRLDKFKEFIKHLGVLGIILGFVISTALHPFFASTVAHFYAYLDAPGYQDPDIELEYRRVSAPYPNNETIPHLDNFTWKEDFQMYRLHVKNNDIRSLDNFVAILRFPGCVEYVNDQGPGVGGDFFASPVVQTPIYDLDYEGSKLHCSYQIQADNLGPGELITAEFVVSQNYNRCDLLLGYNPNPILFTTYYWEKDNVKFTEVEKVSLTNKGPFFDGVKMKPEQTAFIEGEEHNGLPFRTFVYGFEDKRVAALDCSIPPELNNVTFTE